MFISDQTYLNWQRKLAGNKIFRWFWVFWAIYSVLLLFILGGYLAAMGKIIVIIQVISAIIIARFVVKPAVFLFYKKLRPYQKFNFLPISSVLFSKTTKKPTSFPSDHASCLAAIGAVLYLYSPLLGILTWALALLNGPARIILGYHYPEDIAVGWLFGIFVGIITVYLTVFFGFTPHY